jgi:mRNA interferase MazF
VVTAQRVLGQSPRIVHVVPMTRTIRGYASEVTIAADVSNGLEVDSAAQCQHIRAVAAERIAGGLGNVGSPVLAQIRETLAVLLDV